MGSRLNNNVPEERSVYWVSVVRVTSYLLDFFVPLTIRRALQSWRLELDI